MKNGHQKDVCYNEIGLRVLTKDTIFAFNGKHNRNSLCDHFKEE